MGFAGRLKAVHCDNPLIIALNVLEGMLYLYERALLAGKKRPARVTASLVFLVGILGQYSGSHQNT